MYVNRDAYGELLLKQYRTRTDTAEIVERDDGYIDTGSDGGLYFRQYKQWSQVERRAIKLARGRVLDVGCGAGRHALHLQQDGFDVTGIDSSPGAIEVCKSRGLKQAIVRSITDVHLFKPDSFETVIMFGNNFGLFGSPQRAKQILKKLHRITSADAQIIAGTLNPYKTNDPDHLDYHKLNKERNRMPGQIRMRVRYRRAIGAWFDYLFVSPEEMENIFRDTDWRITKFLAPEEAHFFAVVKKKSWMDSSVRR